MILYLLYVDDFIKMLIYDYFVIPIAMSCNMVVYILVSLPWLPTIIYSSDVSILHCGSIKIITVLINEDISGHKIKSACLMVVEGVFCVNNAA